MARHALTTQLAGLATATALGTIVYVSPNGNNSTGMRGRIDLPFLTAAGAIDSSNGPQTNDIVMFMPGTYTGDVEIFGPTRGWSSAFGLSFILDNATIIGNFSCAAGVTGDQGYSVIGNGKSKVVGSIGLGHGGHTIKRLINIEVTDGVCVTVTNGVNNCTINYATTQLDIYSSVWEDTIVTCTNPYGLGRGYVPIGVPDGMTFRRCTIKVNNFGILLGNSKGVLKFENCTVSNTDDTKDLFFYCNGLIVGARNTTFNFGKKFYQCREDNGYVLEESFYLHNCILFSRTDTSLIAKTANASAEPSYLEMINCTSNVPSGAPMTLDINNHVSSFTNF